MPPEVSRVGSRWFGGWQAAAAVLVAAVGLTFYLRSTSPSGPGGVVPGSRPDADHVPSGSASAPAPGSAPTSASSAPAASTSGAPGTATASSPSAVASGTATSKLPKPLRALGPGDIALYLPASTLRGSRPTASITSATQMVRLDIEIEAPVPSLVTIAVRAVPATGQPAWSEADVLTVRVRGGEHIASVLVPARVLPTGAIEIVVTSADRSWTPRVFPFLLRRN